MPKEPDFEPTLPSPDLPSADKIDMTEYALEMLDKMGEDRHEILITRTLRRLGVEDVSQTDAEEFSEALTEELKIMMVSDTMQKLERMGMVEIVGIDDQGSLQYAVTEKGRLAAEG